MWVLAFDTASPDPGLGLLRKDPDGSHAYWRQPLGTGSAELLPGALEVLLSSAGISINQIGRIGVLSGPGSFTGIRAGLAFARGLSRALEIPLMAVGTFEAALVARPEPAEAVFLLEAGRGEVHAVERTGTAIPRPRLAKRHEIVQSPEEGGRPVFEIGTFDLVEAAAALVAENGDRKTGLAPMYGRPSAAEERFGPPEVCK
jgi:tRNA threonylcarbamoyl adenosine modification protein YeaZ